MTASPPAERYHTLAEALAYTGVISEGALRNLLWRYPDLAGKRYRKADGRRLLTDAECRAIAERAIVEKAVKP